MTDFSLLLANLRRPALLIRAARFGQQAYRRERDLRRIARLTTPGAPHKTLPILVEVEATLEEARTKGEGHYDVARHIEVLAALMGEARLACAGTQTA